MRTDEELVSCFVHNGDPGAFDELVQRHLPLIRRLLFGVLGGNEEDIQDAQQEVLVALCRGLSGFRGRSAFQTWLYRFVKNRGIDFLRRITRMRAKDERIRHEAEHLSAHAAEDPVEAVLRHEHREQIAQALCDLPEDERLLLTMREIDDMGLQDISRVLRVPVGTVKSRLHRTRARFAGVLQERGVYHEL